MGLTVDNFFRPLAKNASMVFKEGAATNAKFLQDIRIYGELIRSKTYLLLNTIVI